jgi:multidrug resistance efflux pump
VLAAVEAELAKEQARVQYFSKAAPVAPVSGVVWTRLGNAGQVVKQNEPLFEIADSATLFVEALLHQRHLSTVGPGCNATILLTGGQTLTGKVRAVRTQGPADHEPSFALNVADHDLKQVRVLIDFDAGTENSALIGRHVRVLITPNDPGLLDRAVTWLFTRVRS